MIPGIITPAGNLGALSAHQVIVQPIADAAVAVGDLVKFDLDDAGSGGFADAAAYDDPDNKRNPLNVVKLAVAGASATTEKGGIWGIVTEGAVAGARCRVCVSGILTAKINGATSIGQTTLIAGAGVLIPSPTTDSANSSPALALALQTNASGAATIRILFQGMAFARNGTA